MEKTLLGELKSSALAVLVEWSLSNLKSWFINVTAVRFPEECQSTPARMQGAILLEKRWPTFKCNLTSLLCHAIPDSAPLFIKLSRHLLMLIALMTIYSICVLSQRSYTAWNSGICSGFYLSDCVCSYFEPYYTAPCSWPVNPLKFKRPVVHKFAHFNALIPYSPASLSHLFQIEDITAGGIFLTALLYCLYCLLLLPSYIPAFFPSLLALFPCFCILDLFQPFWFTPSFETWEEAGKPGVQEQGICEAANPSLTCWATDDASRGAAWRWQWEDLILLPLALVLFWCIDVYERPSGVRREKEPGHVVLSFLGFRLGQSESTSVFPEYTSALICSFLWWLYFQTEQAGSYWTSALPSPSTSQTNLPSEFIYKATIL